MTSDRLCIHLDKPTPCLGLRAPGFEKYADDRPSCQNIPAMIAGSEILAVNEIATYLDDNDKEEERKRSLRFVWPRKTTILLTLTHFLFCFITGLQRNFWSILF